ncbi:MAG: sugar ABC transporter permease [Spirochaetales bacterium]|nr:sugar ABC transporter permease [Spirochaetales bacterium]
MVGLSREDVAFNTVIYICLAIVFLVMVYPLWFILIASFSDPNAVYNGKVLIVPFNPTLKGYELILDYRPIWIGYRNAFMYLFLGTLTNLAVILPAAYALSRKDLVGRGIIMGIFVFTMFFGGGIIPTYLLIKKLGLYNTIFPMILLPAVPVYLMIITRTFFQTTIPDELLAAAKIDGCTNRKFFWLIVLPISPAIIAVLALFTGVGHWNQFFLPLIYLDDEQLKPLQLVLRDLLTQVEWLAQELGGVESFLEQQKMADLMKYGVIIVASIPMLLMYPFVQKYFVQGIMIGSIKG